uniref:Uncharacterized protein n=1 Tax=Panagrolaimus sp. PS1159 TaxID=55785 RepID=A0AC35G8P3_9BILA
MVKSYWNHPEKNEYEPGRHILFDALFRDPLYELDRVKDNENPCFGLLYSSWYNAITYEFDSAVIYPEICKTYKAASECLYKSPDTAMAASRWLYETSNLHNLCKISAYSFEKSIRNYSLYDLKNISRFCYDECIPEKKN